MQYTRKPLLALLAIILFICISNISFAQHLGMGAVRAQQNRQFMNQQMTMQMNMNRNWRIDPGEGETYTIVLKDDSVKREIVSYIYRDSVLHKDFLLDVDYNIPESDSTNHFKRIYSNQTLRITSSRINSFGDEVPIYGFSVDTGWVFRVINGPVNVYARSAGFLKSVGLTFMGEPKMDFDPSAIIGIQINDGAIEQLTKESVSKIIANDAKASKLLDKKGMYEAVEKYNHDTEKAAKK